MLLSMISSKSVLANRCTKFSTAYWQTGPFWVKECRKTRCSAHCLFSAALAALKSLKYCVIAFAASLCSLIVGPLFAGLQGMTVYLLLAIKARTDRKVYACCCSLEIYMFPELTFSRSEGCIKAQKFCMANAIQGAIQQHTSNAARHMASHCAGSHANRPVQGQCSERIQEAYADEALDEDCCPVLSGAASLIDTSGFFNAEPDSAAI